MLPRVPFILDCLEVNMDNFNFIAPVPTVTAKTLSNSDKLDLLYLSHCHYDEKLKEVTLYSAEYVEWFIKNNYYILYVNYSVYNASSPDGTTPYEKTEKNFVKDFVSKCVDIYVEDAGSDVAPVFVIKFKVL